MAISIEEAILMGLGSSIGSTIGTFLTQKYILNKRNHQKFRNITRGATDALTKPFR